MKVAYQLIMDIIKIPLRQRKVWPVDDEIRTKVRQWKTLETNIRFFCNGRITFGPGIWIWWVLIFLQMFSTLSVFSWFEVLPYAINYVDFPAKIVLILLGITSLWNLLMIVFTDPGILPKETDPEKLKSIVSAYLANTDPSKIVFEQNGAASSLCTKCHVFRPDSIRAYHCETCNACIEKYDHHCVVFGTCIGVRNYRYFVRFLLATVSSLLGIIAFSLYNLITKWIDKGFCAAAAESPTSFIILGAFIIPPAGLINITYLAYIHLKLTCSDKTLKEKEAQMDLDELSLESVKNDCCCQPLFGGLSNFCSNVCTNPPPRNFDPRKYVEAFHVPAKDLGVGLNTNKYMCDVNIYALNPKKKKRLRKIPSFRKLFGGAFKVRTRSLSLKRLQTRVLIVKSSQDIMLRTTRKLNKKKGFYDPHYIRNEPY